MCVSFADLQSTETFRTSGGPRTVVGILNDYSQNLDILNNGFTVVAAASTGNEVLKESFMELKIDELIMRILSDPSGLSKGSIHSLYDTIRILLTPDDNRVVASQVSKILIKSISNCCAMQWLLKIKHVDGELLVLV
jgi:hypothetical protein